MTRLDNMLSNINGEGVKLSWLEEAMRNKPDTDKDNESKDVDSDKKSVKDPQPDTPDTDDNSTDKGDGNEDIASAKEGGKDPQSDNDDNSDFIEIDEGIHQSSYHSSMDYYPEDSDWLI